MESPPAERIRMKTIKANKLTYEAFRKFGTFAKILDPEPPYLGDEDSQNRFYRDILPITALDGKLSISAGVARPAVPVVDILEIHTKTPEAFMMLDGDAVMAFAPASAENEIPVGQIEAFYIPKGVMIYLRPGVWHYGHFPAGDGTVTSIVLLPERTYCNDCLKRELSESDRLQIVLE